jgi:protein-S-isoprenylcysteine O-methyltransferase Ste14
LKFRLKIFQNLRKTTSIALSVLLVLILTFTHPTWQSGSLLGLILEICGLLLMLIATTGRVFSSLFISGRKSNKLVDAGPYSIVRNPLYLFSFVGVIGLGLCSQNMIFLMVSSLAFIVYYFFVIRAEETSLGQKFGEQFSNYMNRTPMIIPSFKNLDMPSYYEVDIKRVSRAFLDAIGLWGAYSFLRILNYLHMNQILPLR